MILKSASHSQMCLEVWFLHVRSAHHPIVHSGSVVQPLSEGSLDLSTGMSEDYTSLPTTAASPVHTSTHRTSRHWCSAHLSRLGALWLPCSTGLWHVLHNRLRGSPVAIMVQEVGGRKTQHNTCLLLGSRPGHLRLSAMTCDTFCMLLLYCYE